jgi:hypothetical protein
MRTFRLTIEMENEAMRSRRDVAGALRGLAKRLEDGESEGRIMDENGNTVGRFSVTASGEGRR